MIRAASFECTTATRFFTSVRLASGGVMCVPFVVRRTGRDGGRKPGAPRRSARPLRAGRACIERHVDEEAVVPGAVEDVDEPCPQDRWPGRVRSPCKTPGGTRAPPLRPVRKYPDAVGPARADIGSRYRASELACIASKWDANSGNTLSVDRKQSPWTASVGASHRGAYEPRARTSTPASSTRAFAPFLLHVSRDSSAAAVGRVLQLHRQAVRIGDAARASRRARHRGSHPHRHVVPQRADNPVAASRGLSP